MTASETLPSSPHITTQHAGVTLVASRMHCYPGEQVELFSRAILATFATRCQVQIIPPPGFKYLSCQASGLPEGANLSFVMVEQSSDQEEDLDHEDKSDQKEMILSPVWEFDGQGEGEYQFQVTVEAHNNPSPPKDRAVVSKSILISEGYPPQAAEVMIRIRAKGAYLKYLPSIYLDDELMGRLLMLFESYLAPLEERIHHIPYYFDARFTPREVIPWLASWVGLVMDETLTEPQRRRLLWKAISLYQMRGTRQQLKEYLEIVTGARVEVDDTEGLRLGPQSYLGLGMPLGEGNPPNVFTVAIYMPPWPEDLGEAERSEQEETLRRKVNAVIETEKPAHTRCRLKILYQ